MDRALRAGLVLLVVVVTVLMTVWLLQRRLIYFPDTAVPPIGSVPPGAQEITLRTEDGLALGAWYLTPTRANRDITVLVMPGNAGSRALRAPLARRLVSQGFAVLLLDYRGYGGNPGNPSEDGLIADARAARTYLLDHGGACQLFRVRPGKALSVRSTLGMLPEFFTEFSQCEFGGLDGGSRVDGPHGGADFLAVTEGPAPSPTASPLCDLRVNRHEQT